MHHPTQVSSTTCLLEDKDPKTPQSRSLPLAYRSPHALHGGPPPGCFNDKPITADLAPGLGSQALVTL